VNGVAGSGYRGHPLGTWRTELRDIADSLGKTGA
jgi:hypothetical protein